MKTNYKKPFAQFVKKASNALKLAIQDEVAVICADPGVGEEKHENFYDELKRYLKATR